MTLYETTFIINPQTDDATIDGHVRQVADLIKENSGKIRFEDHMGTRRLAYEIAGLTQGYYASFIFEAPKTLLPVLERHYKLNESYIRHLTVRYEGDIEKLEGQVAKDAGETDAIPVEKAAETPAGDAPAEETVEAETAKVEIAEPAGDEPVAPESEEVKSGEESPEGTAPDDVVQADESSQDDEEL